MHPREVPLGYLPEDILLQLRKKFRELCARIGKQPGMVAVSRIAPQYDKNKRKMNSWGHWEWGQESGREVMPPPARSPVLLSHA